MIDSSAWERLAAIAAVVAAGVSFKPTAGLHHALRNTDPETGFEQHPIADMNDYLGRLDHAPTPLPAGERVLAAFGPKLVDLEVRRDRRRPRLPDHPRIHRSDSAPARRREYALSRRTLSFA
jgi:hypothetical protein